MATMWAHMAFARSAGRSHTPAAYSFRSLHSLLKSLFESSVVLSYNARVVNSYGIAFSEMVLISPKLGNTAENFSGLLRQ